MDMGNLIITLCNMAMSDLIIFLIWSSETSMGRVFSTCLPMFMSKGHDKYISSAIKYECFYGFCSSFSDDLYELGTSLVGTSISLRWLAKAMNLLKRMQGEFLSLVEESNLHVSSAGADGFDEYMRETLILLDMCNLLKSSISRVERHRLIVNFNVAKMCHCQLGAINDIGIEEQEKANASDLLPQVEVPRDQYVHGITSKHAKHRRALHPVLHVFKCTMRIVSSLLVSALVAPVSISIDVCNESNIKFPQVPSFAPSIRVLVGKLQGSVHSGVSCLMEYEEMRRQVEHVNDQMGIGKEKAVRSVELLKKSCDDLKEGLELFDSALNELFEEVIKGRARMMKMFYV